LSKTPLIILSFLLVTACSSTNLNKTVTKAENTYGVSVRDVLDRNFANNDFSIKKIEVGFSSEGEYSSFLAGIKFKYPSTWLITIRSNTGLEIVRIFIDRDSVWVNNRIQRKLYVGNCESFERKYGLYPVMLPMFIGDLLCSEAKATDRYQCNKEEIQFNDKLGDFDIDNTINCSDRKIKKSIMKNGSQEILSVRIEKSKKMNDNIFPERILLKSGRIKATLRIKALDFDLNKIESILFMPGKGYEREIME
jgi:hypothetical protein